MLRNIKKLSEHAGMHLPVLASTVVLFCSFVNTVHAIPFTSIEEVYFFGDSLTDSGFNNEVPFAPGFPAGKAPTFTTYGGYTYAQYLAHDIKKYKLIPRGTYVPPGYSSTTPIVYDTVTNNTTPLNGSGPVDPILMGIDYAAGGSTTNSTGNDFTWAPSLHMQVDYFLNTYPHQRLNSKALYLIWSGANDILEVLESTSPTQLQFLQAANTAAINIAHDVARLSERGAKRIVVMSLPNIGYTPLVDLYAQAEPTLPLSMKNVTFTFNSMLNQELGKVIKKTGVKILYYDVYDLLDNVILAAKAGRPYVVAGESFFFANYTAPACGFFPAPPDFVSAIECPNTDAYPTGGYYLFADAVHPADAAHRLLSLALEEAILGWK